MINNPQDIEEILDIIDNITLDQLDVAIKQTDKFFETRSDYMKILGNYKNGNYNVYIMEDGTKIRSSDDDTFIPERVESIDLKITDYCDMECPFCYEASSVNGTHADLNDKILNTFPEYTEVAIGGGNPLSHPDLEKFLMKLKEQKCFANITVNQVHFIKDFDRIKKLSDEKLIYGIGVSVFNPDRELAAKMNDLPNSVAHIIAGVATEPILKKMKECGITKILILGYKTKGRGLEYYPKMGTTVNDNINALKDNLLEVRSMFDIISFDNLALKQLDVKSFMSKEEWDKFYMGYDGQYTMYVDLVSKKYGRNSTGNIRKNLLKSINDMFLEIRESESKTQEDGFTETNR